MAVISDVTELLGVQLDRFKGLIDIAKNKATTAISAAETKAVAKFQNSPGSLSRYLAAHNIGHFLDGKDFREDVSTLRSAAQTEMSNLLSQVQSSYTVAKNNVNTDFNEDVVKAQQKMIDAINANQITDVDFQTKYDAMQTQLQEAVQAAVDAITSHVATVDDSYMVAQAEAKTILNQTFEDFIYNRPIVRYTGTMNVPVAPSFDGTDEVSVELENIGGEPWVGYIGLKLEDEYYKKYENNDVVQPLYTILPGQTSMVKRNFVIPEKIKTTPKTGASAGKEVAMNWGNRLTYTAKVNTRIGG